MFLNETHPKMPLVPVERCGPATIPLPLRRLRYCSEKNFFDPGSALFARHHSCHRLHPSATSHRRQRSEERDTKRFANRLSGSLQHETSIVWICDQLSGNSYLNHTTPKLLWAWRSSRHSADVASDRKPDQRRSCSL